LLWVGLFADLDHLSPALATFGAHDKDAWLRHRHGHKMQQKQG